MPSIDPGRSLQRFYALAVQSALFGCTSLARAWGRIGTAGQTLIETFDHPADTAAAFAHLERTKRRRGYCDAAQTALP